MGETRKTTVYKITLLVIDHDEVGADGIKQTIEGTRYPNHCISPEVKAIESRVVDWDDDHPLNQRDTAEAEYRRLFERWLESPSKRPSLADIVSEPENRS